jgi:uncharacterized protein YcfJ
MAGHNVLYKNQKRPNYQAATIDSNNNPALFSFCRHRSTRRMAGHNVRYKRKRNEDQAVTIDMNSDPVLLSLRMPRSTRRMTGHDVQYKRKKENDQAVTMDNNSDTRATINNYNLPLPRKSNKKVCVVIVELE